MINAALLVLVLWPGHEIDLDGCRPRGTVTGYSIAMYQGTPPRLLPAVEQMQEAARKRGADTIEVTEYGYLRPGYAPRWMGQWFVFGRALKCEEG